MIEICNFLCIIIIIKRRNCSLLFFSPGWLTWSLWNQGTTIPDHLVPCLSCTFNRQIAEPTYQHNTGTRETLPALDTTAPTYHHAVFCNIPPQVIYPSTDITDRPIHIPAHYCMTQTDSVCFAATNQTHLYSHIWHHQTSHVNLRGRSIIAGERASLCNDDAYQCLSCKPRYWFSSAQPIRSTIYHAWKSAVMCLHRIQYPLLLMNSDKQLNLCILFWLNQVSPTESADLVSKEDLAKTAVVHLVTVI